MSIVRQNLMESASYRPYCGAENCNWHWPRTMWGGRQFACKCGWVSSFEKEFIAEYKAKWNLP